MTITFVLNKCSFKMPRPKRIRKVTNPPHFKGFKPIGLSEESPVTLNYEEYESIRLSDFDQLGQVEAAAIMQVSRPTYARIYETARRKIAEAFITGKSILFEGGKVFFDSEWYGCNRCGCWFNHPEKDIPVTHCALCHSKDIMQYNEQDTSATDTCPECHKQLEREQGMPGHTRYCPDCGQMTHHDKQLKGNHMKRCRQHRNHKA